MDSLILKASFSGWSNAPSPSKRIILPALESPLGNILHVRKGWSFPRPTPTTSHGLQVDSRVQFPAALGDTVITYQVLPIYINRHLNHVRLCDS